MPEDPPLSLKKKLLFVALGLALAGALFEAIAWAGYAAVTGAAIPQVAAAKERARLTGGTAMAQEVRKRALREGVSFPVK